MKHDHSFAADGSIGHLCRICGSNDIDAVIDEIAGMLWERSRDVALGDPPWEDANDYWRRTLTTYAREMVDIVRR